jgi:hypothetical protein
MLLSLTSLVNKKSVLNTCIPTYITFQEYQNLIQITPQFQGLAFLAGNGPITVAFLPTFIQ